MNFTDAQDFGAIQDQLAAALVPVGEVKPDEDDPIAIFREIRNYLRDHRNDAALHAFRPEKTLANYQFDGATYTQPLIFNVPKSRLGGIHVENNTGTTVRVYLGEAAAGPNPSYLDVPAGAWKAFPVNAWGEKAFVTIALDAASAGRVRVLLSSDPPGPGEGSIVSGGGGGGTFTSAAIINGPATAGMQYASAALGFTRNTTLYINVGGATTISVFVSPDGANWYAADIADTDVAGTTTFTGAGTVAIALPPTNYVAIVSSAAVNVTAQVSGA